MIRPNLLDLKTVPTLAMLLLVSMTARANGTCDPATTSELHTLQRLAHSIRVDKPGLPRVYALDGTEFTAGQALWMKGQLREVEAACVRSDRADAAQRLETVQELVRARSR